MVATLEIALRAISGAASPQFCAGLFVNTPQLDIPSKTRRKYWRKSFLYRSLYSTSWKQNSCLRSCAHKKVNHRSQFFSCQCQRAEDTSGIASSDAKGSWYTSQIPGDLNGQKFASFENGPAIAGNVATNGSPYRSRGSAVDDEAWSLLQDSVVYYCGTPVGTIAAKDPSDSSSNVLNYDQVFIRDFIPSGMAFLLKGEYDIVRNFILHTLQLQVLLLDS